MRAEKKNKRKKGRITQSKDKEGNKESKDRRKKRKEGGSTETTVRLPWGYFSWVSKARVSKARRSLYITI